MGLGHAHGRRWRQWLPRPDPAGVTGHEDFWREFLSGNYSLTPGGPFYLTAGPFNLTGDVATKLRFARWLNTDVQPNATATVDVSNDGVNWTNVFSNSTVAITDSSWQTVQYDISSVADNRSTIYVRWGYQIASGALAYSGWNIDDVRVLGTTNATTPTATPQTVSMALRHRYAGHAGGCGHQQPGPAVDVQSWRRRRSTAR